MIRTVQIGTYKHFKGTIYEVLGVSLPMKGICRKGLSIFSGYHTETGESIQVSSEKEIGYYHNESESIDKLVIYKNINDNRIFLRPEDMFMSKVDKIKYPDVEQKYRFEPI